MAEEGWHCPVVVLSFVKTNIRCERGGTDCSIELVGTGWRKGGLSESKVLDTLTANKGSITAIFPDSLFTGDEPEMHKPIIVKSTALQNLLRRGIICQRR
uniref:Uncharacterized protein n=1 Tax=Parascaris equorum TaxID=6256 RepID=A0A914RLK0_PAREQ